MRHDADERLDRVVESLREETPAEDLPTRIARTIRTETLRKQSLRRRALALVGAFSAVAVAGLLLPKAATAVTIPVVRESFQEAHNYRTKTFQVIDGKRRLASKSEMRHGRLTITLIGPDGKERPVSDEIQRLRNELNVQIDELDRADLRSPNLVGSMIQRSYRVETEKALTPLAPAVNPQKIDIAELKTLLKELQSALGELNEKLEHMASSGTGGAQMISGDSSARLTEQLLQHSDLWADKGAVILDGASVTKFSLRNPDQRFDLYVDAPTGLPHRVSFQFDIGTQAVSVETHFEYPPYRTSP